MLEATKIGEGWLNEIASLVQSSQTMGEVESRLADWAHREEERPAFADLIYESSARAWMAGQLFVRDVEMPDSLSHKLAVEVGASGSFLSLPFDMAIDLFIERDILSPELAFNALGQLRERAFTARRLATQSVRERAFGILSTLYEQGSQRERNVGESLADMAFNDFAESLRSYEISLGIAPSNHGYLRTVFDTNVVSAYSAGRDQQLTDPDVVEAIPYRTYAAVVDARTRPEHAALDGTTWDARETDEWREFQGPNGYNCRCQVISSEEPEKTPTRGVRHPETAFQSVPGTGPLET